MAITHQVKGFEAKLTLEDLENMTEEERNSNLIVTPEEPVEMMYDENGQVMSVIYGDMERLMQGDPVVIWTQDIVRDPATGQVTSILTVRPDGNMTEETFVRDPVTNKLLKTTLAFL